MIIFTILGWMFFFLSLPVVLELSVFLVANLARLFRHPPKSESASRAVDPIAILIPAHNEEKFIQRCIASLQKSDSGSHAREIVVIADNCSDQTATLAREAGARVIERIDETVRGKGAALNYAINLLSREPFQAFIIVDADSVVAPNFIRIMGDEFASGKDALQCVYLPRNLDDSPKIRLMNLALLSMNVFRPMGRETMGCSVGIMGNGFGLSRSLLNEIPYSANSITEDLEYHINLIERGKRVRFILGTQVLADFPVSKKGSETQRERWEGGRFLLQRKFAVRLIKEVLSGRLSFIEPCLELLSLPLSYGVLLLIALIFIPGQLFTVYGIIGITIVLIHILASVLQYGKISDLRALLEVPQYIIWKIARLPQIFLTSRKGATWIRTKRD